MYQSDKKSKEQEGLSDRRCLSAKGWLLFPLALRPRLFLLLKMPNFDKNSRKIVILLAIFNIFGVFFAKNAPASAASLTLSVPSSLSLNISPSTSPIGFFAKSTTPGKISISTDNSSGYTLSIKAKNNENSNSLLNGTHQLTSISSSLSEDQYKTSGNLNTWGYLPDKLDGVANTNFIPGPTIEGSTLDTTESANTENNDYNLTLAAKVDSSIPAGSYTNTFIISALANAPKYDDTMQNWAANTDNCANLPDGQILNLQDTRDESIYRVAKLADGKCWMVDNLKIVNKPITDADSDLQPGASFTIPDSAKSGFTGSDNNAAYYGGTKDSSGDDYGSHYSWYTATAGTGTSSMSTDGQEATSSICPKGWRLPRGGANGDFQKLYDSGYNNISKLTAKPIPGFTYAGRINGSSLGYQGSVGFYWSSTVNSNSNAYDLDIYASDGIYPQDYSDEYLGFSVRCIARDPDPSPELLTQQWTADADEINVSVDRGIEMIMIADGSDNWKPYYAFPGKDVNLSGTSGKKYIISVVPEPNNMMTDLTKQNGKISAKGTKGSYTSMQDFSQCTEQGTNVTDIRNGISYTVAKIGDKCWMLSNLRLAAGTVLNSATSNVSSSFTLPTTAWSNDAGRARMEECHGTAGNDSSNTTCNNTATGITEYYYNWYAAKANPSTSGSYTSSADAMSLGSICPKNWSLPYYSSDVTAANAWNNGANPGMLATVGNVYSGTQYNVGSYTYWWSTERRISYIDYTYTLLFDGTSARRNDGLKNHGYLVRCMR